ncbi:hypothetical protein [Salinispora arenicola]|uniref:hypothetical protein n=1 Tax=Salinispora arenicola TaxID=168697 RepID=UPI00036D80A3|nr:hypothetical protein [Salinispora arenicola]
MNHLTRYTTAQERQNIAGVTLADEQVSYFMDMVSKGLTGAVQAHDSAVQDDMALSAEVTVRLSRPVQTDDGTVEEVVGREVVTGRLTARKVYKDPTKKPVV